MRVPFCFLDQCAEWAADVQTRHALRRAGARRRDQKSGLTKWRLSLSSLYFFIVDYHLADVTEPRAVGRRRGRKAVEVLGTLMLCIYFRLDSDYLCYKNHSCHTSVS
jgi:hypothetical protein